MSEANKITGQAAAEKMQQAMEEMKTMFIVELADRCDDIESNVMVLDKDPSVFDEFSRQVHNLKGTAAMYTLPFISTICHQIEDQMQLVGERFTEVFIDGVLFKIDIMRNIQGRLVRGETEFSDIEKILEGQRQQGLQGRKSVLMLESSPLMVNVYKDALQGLAIEISVVEDGLEGMSRLIKESFDMLIVAQGVKNLNGAAVLGALKYSNSHNDGIPTILISTDKSLAHLAGHHILRDTHLADHLRAVVSDLLRG